MITALILTYNEEIHIERCINSLKGVCTEIVIIDSFSTDRTKAICENLGAKVVQNEFVSQSDQYNWALSNVSLINEWVLRIDADEYLSEKLIRQLMNLNLHNIDHEINGISINRLMYFMGKPLYRGGMYPIRHVRLFKKSFGHCEKRLMDEHIVLTEGRVMNIEGDLIDENLNQISWWISKHNNYATREAIDVLRIKLSKRKGQENEFRSSSSAKARRSFKTMYLKMPLFIRSFALFLYRLLIKGAILEGYHGILWTTFQGLWYRLLVDYKIYEFMNEGLFSYDDFRSHILDTYGYDIDNYN